VPREDVVAVDELVAGLHGLGHLVALVLDDQADLAAVDAAGVVDLVEPHLHRIGRRHPVGCGHARQVGGHPDHDLCLGHAARLRRRSGRDGHQRGSRDHHQSPIHFSFPPFQASPSRGLANPIPG
jgi:hypothetical protein